MKIITKQGPREIISSYLDLNGRAMTYYLGTVTPWSYTDRQESIIPYLIISMHALSSPQVTKAPKQTTQSLCVCSDGPQRSVSQYLSVSHICISVIIIPHAYAPKRQKRPNTWPKASMCVQTGPKGLSFHIICITVSGGEGYCLMILKTIIILIFTYLLTIL